MAEIYAVGAPAWELNTMVEPWDHPVAPSGLLLFFITQPAGTKVLILAKSSVGMVQTVAGGVPVGPAVGVGVPVGAGVGETVAVGDGVPVGFGVAVGPPQLVVRISKSQLVIVPVSPPASSLT